MFNAARALLQLEGYREKNRHCLIVALDELLVQPGRLEEGYLVELQDAKALREEADYRGSFTEAGAEETLRSAMRFLVSAESLIGES